MLFSLLKHYLDTDTALKVSQSVYCFTTSISHGVENYFPRLWGTGISDAIFNMMTLLFGIENVIWRPFCFQTKNTITLRKVFLSIYILGKSDEASCNILGYRKQDFRTNFKTRKFAMATVAAGYPQNLISLDPLGVKIS